MAKIIGHIEVEIEKCKGCVLCIETCPVNVIAMSKEFNGKGYHFMELIADGCIGCANCAVVCPDGVIAVYKAKGDGNMEKVVA